MKPSRQYFLLIFLLIQFALDASCTKNCCIQYCEIDLYIMQRISKENVARYRHFKACYARQFSVLQLVQNLKVKNKTTSKKNCVVEHRHLESFRLFEGIIRLVPVLIQSN